MQQFVLSLCSLVFVFTLTSSAHAASLYLSPSTGTHEVGDVFPVHVYVSSGDEAMNAAGAEIVFPTNKLEVVSLSTSGSIFNFWVDQPSFKNNNGLVGFEGVAFDPGYRGAAGKILTIHFKAKQIGAAPVSFSTGSVLANDGAATNILKGMRDASFSLIVADAVPPSPTPTPSEDNSALPAPAVRSATHPDSSRWYSHTSPSFEWTLPAGVTAVRTALDRSPFSLPSVEYVPPIEEKAVQDLDAGVWYFHVQFKNANGWGAVGHYTVRIDSEAPTKPSIDELERETALLRTVSFDIDASDAHSGIDHYTIRVDDGEEVEWNPSGSGVFVTEVEDPSDYTLYVTAIDRAGNTSMHSTHFIVLGLDAPTLTYVDETPVPGIPLRVQGTAAYAEGVVTLSLRGDQGQTLEYTADIDPDTQRFTFTLDDVPRGTYTGTLFVERSDGARSYRSEPFDVVIGGVRKDSIPAYLLVSFGLVTLLSVLLFILLVMSHVRNRRLIARIHKEVTDVELGVHRATQMLKRDVEEQMGVIRKSKHRTTPTSHEALLVKTVRDDLRDLERYIRRELDSLDKTADGSDEEKAE